MTTIAKPRRYVRVEGEIGSVKATCICRGFLGRRNLDWDADAWASIRRAADQHARTCPAVQAAMERDQLRAERDQWRTKAHQLAAEPLLRDERKETPC